MIKIMNIKRSIPFPILGIIFSLLVFFIMWNLKMTYKYEYANYHLRMENTNIFSENESTSNNDNLANDSLLEETLYKKITIALLSISSKTVMFTIVNDGYANLAKNWLCNTMKMGIHEKILIIATNDKIQSELSSTSSKLKVISISVENELATKHLQYSHAGYLRLMILRTKILSFLLDKDIETFLFECDFLWLNNPLDLFVSKRGIHDLIVIPDTKNGNVINGGFFYLFPTQNTKTVLRKLTEMMIKLGHTIQHLSSDTFVSESQNDQVFFTSLLRKRFAGINPIIMPFQDFPSGQWYRTPVSVTKLWNPFVIHNNYIIGNGNKEDRAKKRRHWFLTTDNKCNISLVDKIVHNYS